MSEKPVTVLLVGRANQRVSARLSEHFNIIAVPHSETPNIPPDAIDKIRGAAIAGPFSAAWMDALPNLELVSSFGVGYDNLDVKHAASRGIVATNTPDVLSDEVADTTIALLLNTVRQLPQAENWLRSGRWAKDGSFAVSPLSLRHRKVGIYGLGRIGLEIAKRLEPFKVTIGYHTRNQRPDVSYTYYPSLKAMAEAVDTLICILPKTEETHKAINADILAALGTDGVLINVGRGWTVDEDALIEALKSGVIAGAGLDVFQDEPHVPAGLLELPNVSLLPHVASASAATRNAMADLVADNLISWFAGNGPISPVPETPVSR
jgi:lactate dehydrogenase-like 2-hydroxyacid dehydrogenase